ncbi:hypothetical protein SLEP1_g57467 [Rubroshorea leprosula]|uniref:Uncharacterized protein n=1 Tax=Rubroshorea leprosula TaxID=152421 RepID=A0AAV5MQW3_9ROSI|nr:hypothetical protein SLEP1_g57467 [Rubroshorea leprosula]
MAAMDTGSEHSVGQVRMVSEIGSILAIGEAADIACCPFNYSNERDAKWASQEAKN